MTLSADVDRGGTEAFSVRATILSQCLVKLLTCDDATLLSDSSSEDILTVLAL